MAKVKPISLKLINKAREQLIHNQEIEMVVLNIANNISKIY